MNPTTPPVTDLPTRDILLNATSLAHTACEQDYNYVVVQGLRTIESNEYLLFGNALHKFAELRALQRDASHSITEAVKSYGGNDTARLVQASMRMPPMDISPYVEPSGKPYVELKFKFYWRSFIYNGVQYNIWLCGTFDIVTMFSDGGVRIRDYKTTRKYKQSDVFISYSRSIQMKFYLWIAMRFGYHVFDMTVANATTQGNVCIQITGIFLSASPPNWVYGGFMSMTMQEMAEFEELLVSHIERTILPAWDAPRRNGMLNNKCQSCDYAPICHAKTEENAANALSMFKHVPYDPMTFR